MLLVVQLIFATIFFENTQNVFGLSRVDPLVETKVGLIRGLAASDGMYSMFMGIPYAKVNESNPFGHSIPYPRFENIFEAYDDSAACPQAEKHFNKTGSLDCLHVNVYVPNTATSQNKVPVMVYVHGGFFFRGLGGRYLYGPKNLVKHDVILVVFNYRLGPYGFMCLDIPEVPGNQGLKDQALALNWVKDNIEAFGGDSRRITIFGESAGAHSVDFHLIYGDEKLFQNAILQSGTALASTVITDSDKSAPQKIAEYLEMPSNSITEALSLLSTVDSKLVIDAADELGLTFKPCVEKEFEDVTPFITKTWINVKKPKVKGKSILQGFNEFERLSYFDKPEQYNNKNIFFENLKETFNFNDKYLGEMEELVRQFYIGDETVNEEVRLAVAHFDSDYKYIYPMQRNIPRLLESAPSNIYYYMFAYVGGRGFNTGPSSTEGATHGDELGYLFEPQFFGNRDTTPEDQHMVDRMTKMWTDFAKYGNPTPEISDLLPVQWTPLSRETYNYLRIDSELTVERRPMYNRTAFWNLFYMLNEKSQKLFEDVD